jgi:tol-pal system protein YbgF
VLQPDAPEPTAAEEPTAEPAEDDSAPRPTVRAGGTAGKGKKAKGEAGAKSADAGKEYEEALSLVKKKQYERAVEALTGFLVRHPDHPNADNAMFWMGEAYLGQNDTSRAVEQWEALLARFPDGNKAPDALLKIALTQKKLGEAEKAKAALARLRSRFPTSDAAKRAPKE